MTYVIRNGRVVDPANGRDGVFDIEVRDGVISKIGTDLPVPEGAAVLDVPAGCIVTPGLIDMHVHLREPGQEHKETVASGVAAAVAGGFTAVACMPNTSPVNDSAAVTRYIVDKAAAANLARVYPIGAVTVGQKGEQLAEIGELKAAGCVAISDDGHPVRTALMMRRALEYAGMLDVLVIDHCEDPTLKGDGVVHEGAVASELGLRGIPGEAEELWIERDITLAGLTKTPFHVAHLSTAGSLRAVRAGKARGIAVTCEVTPHHFVV
ncbi:MAG TPA: dihydroorotase, partial [Luteitalea sp.]|nr:dihydroorotase [Luteitalea sp.]